MNSTVVKIQNYIHSEVRHYSETPDFFMFNFQVHPLQNLKMPSSVRKLHPRGPFHRCMRGLWKLKLLRKPGSDRPQFHISIHLWANPTFPCEVSIHIRVSSVSNSVKQIPTWKIWKHTQNNESCREPTRKALAKWKAALFCKVSLSLVTCFMRSSTVSCQHHLWLVVYVPLWKIVVSWDDYSQHMEQ